MCTGTQRGKDVSKLLPLGCMQAPIIMDQVLLAWDGGEAVLLARIRDGEGSWACYKEMQSKLGSSVPAWHRKTQDGEHRSTGA